MRFDLEVDTEWIRRAAATLEEGGGRCVPPVDLEVAAPVDGPGLGASPAAAQAAHLINLRGEQAVDAAAVLSGVYRGLAAKLQAAATGFEHHEASGFGP